MAGKFTYPGGDLEIGLGVDDYNLIDQYTSGSLWFIGGRGDYGAPGDNTVTSKSSPIQTVAGGTNWKQVSTGGSYSSGGIKTDGTLWMWGYNGLAQLGDGTTTNKSSPVQIAGGGTNWKQLSCGGSVAGAIKTDGTLWMWGYGPGGQLGLYLGLQSASSPVQTVSAGNNWKSISCGETITAAIKTNGTLWTWGDNTSGQLGDGSSGTTVYSPIQTVAGGTNWKQVSAGESLVGAIKTDGTLWMWGDNSNGSLGDNTTTNRSSPIQTIAGGTNWKQVVCGYAVAAIKTDGTLWVWGRNNLGQLGLNNTSKYSSPVQLSAGGLGWKQVVAGWSNMAAIKTDGTLWVWGDNSYGQLGTNNITSYSSPVQTAAGGTNWKQVSCGYVGITAIYFYDDNSLYPFA